jgi:hypothetical protein
MHIGFLWESQEERYHYEGGWIIKMDFGEIGCGSMDWIELAQDGDQ